MTIFVIYPDDDKAETVLVEITDKDPYEFHQTWAKEPDRIQAEFGYDGPEWPSDWRQPRKSVKRTYDQYIKMVKGWIAKSAPASTNRTRSPAKR